MQYHASYTDGTTDTGIVDPASLAEQKRRAIAAILDPESTMYRMRITDPACFGEWDSDDVLGITPKDREAAGDNGESDPVPFRFAGDWNVPNSLPELSAADTPPMPPVQSVIRQSEAASVLARCSRDLYDALTKLDSDDDAAAYYAVQGEALTLASEASSLGWPLDGNGVPLRECRDECGVA